MTLTERIMKDFAKIRHKNIQVKVPKIKIKKNLDVRLRNKKEIPIYSVVTILMRSAIGEFGNERHNAQLIEDKFDTVLEEGMAATFNGGYGTISNDNGTFPHTNYIDYGKLFSYLGKFKSRNAYESDNQSSFSEQPRIFEDNRTLIALEAIESGARYVKYMMPKSTNLDASSLVPIAGMSSSEWEQFKLWMKLDPVMYRLKTSSA